MASALDLVARAVTSVHRSVFDLTKGRVAGKVGVMPVVKLTTTGRKTGKRRDTMLTTPIHDENRVVLIASKGGAPHHPLWYLNLRDNPKVSVTLGGKTRDMVARTATPEEKAELWPDILRAHKGYGDYQKKTDRDIPVVILEPPV